ncbi:hypothetical protein [Mangrovimonas cancribranchiae]|uniref:Lipoprotein n=1 Tax=Mangrovimonas cancribranchiae TaxID=3080055 RepID=A0AAU6NY33_9FLAO
MKIKKIFSVLVVVLFLLLLAACGSAHTNVGLNMHFGPNGPHVSPHVNVDFYGGGRH